MACLYILFRPKSEANGIRYGEATHPGPPYVYDDINLNGLQQEGGIALGETQAGRKAPSAAIKSRLRVWQKYGSTAFNGKYFWYPLAAIAGSGTSRWPRMFRRTYLGDKTVFRRAKIVNISALQDTPTALVDWFDADGTTAIPLIDLLSTAARIQDSDTLYSPSQMKTNKDKLLEIFSDNPPAMDRYTVLDQFTPNLFNAKYQYETLFNLLMEDGKHDNLDIWFVGLIYMMSVALVRIPRQNEKGEYLHKDSKTKYDVIAAREMILTGKWLQLYTDVENWLEYAKRNNLIKKQSGSNGPNKQIIEKCLRHASLSKATQQLASTGMPAYPDMQLIKEKHPPTKDPMNQADWDALQQIHDNSDSKLPIHPTMDSLMDIINIIRTLDPLSSAGLDGLQPKILKNIARTVTREGGPLGQPKHNFIDKSSQNLATLVYKIATGQMDPISARALRGCRLIMIKKKPKGQRPISIGHALRRVAGRFLMRRKKPQIIQHFGATQMASGSSNGTTKVAMTVQTHLERYKDLLLLKLDASNAFNSVNRKKIITRTIEAFPSMYSYIKGMYFQDAHSGIPMHNQREKYI